MKNSTASSGTKTRGRAAAGGAARGRRGAKESQGGGISGAPNGGAPTEAAGAWSKQNKATISGLKKQIVQQTALGVEMKKNYEQQAAKHEALLKSQKALLEQYETA